MVGCATVATGSAVMEDASASCADSCTPLEGDSSLSGTFKAETSSSTEISFVSNWGDGSWLISVCEVKRFKQRSNTIRGTSEANTGLEETSSSR